LPDRPAQDELPALLAAIRAHVDYQQRLGVFGYPPAPRPVPIPTSAVPAAMPASVDRRTPEVVETADLFAEPGVTRARLVFVGEGPGADEDAKGEPFVGRAGQLLTEIITKGMRLARSDVYIANVIKCRPPGNRNPEPDEVVSCEPFLVRQIELIAPEVIVALGKFAAQTLLRTKTPITQLRGRWFDYHGIRLMPTFHPAYLLRNPADKRLVWQDIRQVMERLGLPGGKA